MIIRRLFPPAGVIAALLASGHSTANVLESFAVTMHDVEVRVLTETSIQFISDKHTYRILLRPNHEGRVMFSLAGIGYASTVRFSNLHFGVRVTGYHGEEIVMPVFNLDDVNRDVCIDRDVLTFRRIYGALPVWFNTQVDSVVLHFSNSHGADIDQYLAIQDLRLRPAMDILPNPDYIPCNAQRVMIALDGSSSIDNYERRLIGRHLLDFVRNSMNRNDPIQFTIVEYGSEILSLVESADRREVISALQNYKRGTHKPRTLQWTNWSAVFDAATVAQPDLLIFISDGWSNWRDERPVSFSAQYETLAWQCNTLKSQGTRLLFVTAELDTQHNSKAIFGSFLNGMHTRESRDADLPEDVRLFEIDLITLDRVSRIREVDFSSILECAPDENEDACADDERHLAHYPLLLTD